MDNIYYKPINNIIFISVIQLFDHGEKILIVLLDNFWVNEKTGVETENSRD